MADDVTFYDQIEGYAGRLSYSPGESVLLHVSTTADTYDAVIERWGVERSEVWRREGIAGSHTPAPADADANGCRWPESVSVEIGSDWRSGFYLVTLTARGAPANRSTSHAGFVVRSASTASSRTRRAVLVLATNTWNAYNNWGGKSLYTGGSRVSFRRPFGRGMLCRPEVERDDRKSRPTRWGEEPDVDGLTFQNYRFDRGYPPAIGSTGWFTFERRFVEWAESEGYEFDFAISADLEQNPTALDGYDLMLSIGHDEYWSARQRRTVERFVEAGGNLASFSGNTMFWQVRLEGDDHDPHAWMVCHKYTAHITDPVTQTNPELTTGMWCDPIVGNPEWRLLGGGSAFGLYYRFGAAVMRGSGGFTVYRDDHWLLANSGLRYGDVLGAKHGAVGYETLGVPLQFDEYQLPVVADRPDVPSDSEVVAFAPASNCAMGEYPKSISALSDQGDLEFIAERVYGAVNEDNLKRARHGNAVLLVCRPFDGGGEVVTVGTTDWAFALADDEPVAQVTRNVLDRYTGA